MTNNEFYYLLLVLGSFLVFAVGLAGARIRYVAWLRATGGDRHVAAPAPLSVALTRESGARAA